MFDQRDMAIILVMIETMDKISQYTGDIANCEEFERDIESFDATIMNFIVLGEFIGKLSEQFKDEHPDIDWRKIYAFRNVLAHDYFGIYPAEVWEIIRNHLPKLRSGLETILENGFD